MEMQQMMELLLASQERMIAKMIAWLAERKDRRKETMACQVTMEACLDSKEPNPEDRESEVEHRNAPTEEAAVKSSGAMKKRHRSRHLAAGGRGEPKELTRGDGGSRRKLAAACRKVSRRARMAWRKRIIVTNYWLRGKVGRGTLRVRTLRKRLRTRQESRMQIKDLSDRRPLYLRKPMERTRGHCGSLKQLVATGMRMTTVQKWHGATKTGFRGKAKTMSHRELRRDERPGRTLEGPGMQNWNEEPRH
jgi:hypothetical protein